MNVTRRIDETTRDIWVDAWEGEHQIGGYKAGASRSTQLTVFWHGVMDRQQFRAIVADAEHVFARVGSFSAKLTAFGPTRESVGPVTAGLADYLSPDAPLSDFDAYRVELDGAAGEMVVWANVAEMSAGGTASFDNIGISASPDLFNGSARELIRTAISRSKTLPSITADRLLVEISEATLPRG